MILKMVADRQRHHITELLRLPLTKEHLDAALSRLIEEEKVLQEDGFLTVR